MTDRNIEIMRKYYEGQSKAGIAREYNLSRERIRQIVQRIDGEMECATWGVDTLSEIRDVSRLRNKDIADKMNLKPSTVINCLAGRSPMSNRRLHNFTKATIESLRERLDKIDAVLKDLPPLDK